jgi:hypothetical protein
VYETYWENSEKFRRLWCKWRHLSVPLFLTSSTSSRPLLDDVTGLTLETAQHDVTVHPYPETTLKWPRKTNWCDQNKKLYHPLHHLRSYQVSRRNKKASKCDFSEPPSSIYIILV